MLPESRDARASLAQAWTGEKPELESESGCAPVSKVHPLDSLHPRMQHHAAWSDSKGHLRHDVGVLVVVGGCVWCTGRDTVVEIVVRWRGKSMELGVRDI